MRQILMAVTFAVSMLSSSLAAAADARLTISLPRLSVAEYHPPYISVWIEDEQRQATHVAVWYDIALKNGEGQEWLKDLRQWWRRGGRGLSMPVDGLSGATKGPGEHMVSTQLSSALVTLPPGKYSLLVEAAREVGGREVLQLPLELPLKKQKLPIEVTGQREISFIRLHF